MASRCGSALRGVSARFPEVSCGTFADHRIGRLLPVNFGVADGLRSAQGPAGIGGGGGDRHRDGSLWFMTSGGIAVYKPDSDGVRFRLRRSIWSKWRGWPAISTGPRIPGASRQRAAPDPLRRDASERSGSNSVFVQARRARFGLGSGRTAARSITIISRMATIGFS